MPAHRRRPGAFFPEHRRIVRWRRGRDSNTVTSSCKGTLLYRRKWLDRQKTHQTVRDWRSQVPRWISSRPSPADVNIYPLRKFLEAAIVRESPWVSIWTRHSSGWSNGRLRSAAWSVHSSTRWPANNATSWRGFNRCIFLASTRPVRRGRPRAPRRCQGAAANASGRAPLGMIARCGLLRRDRAPSRGDLCSMAAAVEPVGQRVQFV